MKINQRYFVVLLVGLNLGLQCWGQSQAGGFTQEWANYAPGEFGTVQVTLDSTGLRQVEAVPGVGIHPRILFGPSELVSIRANLQNSLAGQQVMRQIHAYTTLLHFGYGAGGTYSHNADYGKDDYGNRWIGNAGAWSKKTQYDGLLALDPNALSGISDSDKYKLASIMALEAFECLVHAGQIDSTTGRSYNDRSTDLAKAMSFWAQLVVGDPNLNSDNWEMFGGVHMAYCYDFNYNNMTPNQRDSVRMGLAAIVPAYPRYGAFTAPYATASNWVGLNSFDMLINMAIEGEVGYNPTYTQHHMRAYMNFLTYGWYASGTPLEGQGKNYQMNCALVAAAKRGYSLLGHPHVRAYGSQYLPNNVQPYGHSFVSADAWGGNGWDNGVGGYKFNAMDVIGLKWAMPNDPGVDFAWRNYIERWYGNDSKGYVYQAIPPVTSGYQNYLVPAAVFAEDYTAGSWSSQFMSAAPALSFLAPERGKAILRSSHDSTGMMLQMFSRQDLGGHTYADRNSFILSGLGRTWVRYTYGSSFQESEFHSMVLVDSLGITVTNKEGRKARQPAKIVHFSDSARLAQVTGDATYAYSWEWHWESRPANQDHSWLGTNGWTKVTESWNDFRYQAGTEPHHSLPFYDFASWVDSSRFERLIKRPANTMQRVYRTAAVVRTQQPFALVIDDIQKDDTTHLYQWFAQTANDLVIDSIVVNLDTANYRSDVILSAAGGSRHLLVRVLENKGFATGGPAWLDTLDHNINGNSPLTRLVIEANVVAPDFKVLLFPFEDGDSLPHTAWNSDRDQLTVSFPTDTIVLDLDTTGGRTILTEHVPAVIVGRSQGDAGILSVYPNPGRGRYSVQVELSALPVNGSLTVYNAHGQVVWQQEVTDQHILRKIDLSNQPAGVYFMTLRSSNLPLQSRKLIQLD